MNKELVNNYTPSELNQKIIDFYNTNPIIFIDDSKIEVDKKLLAQLLRDSYKLSCLEVGGVDNWINYAEALNSKGLDGKNYWDFINKSDSEIIKDFIE